MTILVVEDDKNLANSLQKGLSEEGHYVKAEMDSYKARDLILGKKWDLFIFDLMLPGLNGVQLCELLRFKKIDTPVLMLSALSETEDKVNALDTGADDYMTKPFHFPELISRINALNRRYSSYNNQNVSRLSCADLTLDITKNHVIRAEQEIDLSSKEFKLLQTLLEDKDNVVSRHKLLEKVWETNHSTFTNVIDVYISYLRRKIETNYPQKLIHTIKGRGYMITEPK